MKRTGNYRSSCKACWAADCKERAAKQEKLKPGHKTLQERKYRESVRNDPERHRIRLAAKDKWNRSDKYYDGYYKKRFGISFAEVNSMLAIQNGRCANLGCSCEIAIHPNGEQKKAIVDHCHATGRVRSMMCQRCNTTLGHVENTQTVVLGLFDYLNKHSTKGT